MLCDIVKAIHQCIIRAAVKKSLKNDFLAEAGGMVGWSFFMAFKHAVKRVNKGTCVAGRNMMFEILRQGLCESEGESSFLSRGWYRENAFSSSSPFCPPFARAISRNASALW